MAFRENLTVFENSFCVSFLDAIFWTIFQHCAKYYFRKKGLYINFFGPKTYGVFTRISALLHFLGRSFFLAFYWLFSLVCGPFLSALPAFYGHSQSHHYHHLQKSKSLHLAKDEDVVANKAYSIVHSTKENSISIFFFSSSCMFFMKTYCLYVLCDSFSSSEEVCFYRLSRQAE